MRLEAPATVLVTGIAGFIGYHCARRLLDDGFAVIGIDNLSDYYDPALKLARMAMLEEADFKCLDLADSEALESFLESRRFDAILHLGAQAGVRFSIDRPSTYIQSNIVGTANLLELAKQRNVQHFVYASSSSIYGLNRKMPFSESDGANHPVSLYAATKKSTELLAHSYSHLFRIPTTGLRFFTVYGPWGRPDMAAFKFTESILAGRPIDVYNEGRMRRDFTYVDDIVAGTIGILRSPAEPDLDWNPVDPPAESSTAPYRIYNIGNHQSVELMRFIEVLEEALGKKAQINLLPLQPGDVLETYADISQLHRAIGYEPSTPIEVGIPRFVAWYREYFKV